MHGRRRLSAVAGASVVAGAMLLTCGAASAANARACALLTPADLQKIVGTTVETGTPGGVNDACSYHAGPGGNGFIVIQYYDGVLGKNIWAAAKKQGERLGSTYVIGDGIANAYRHGKTVAASYSLDGAKDAAQIAIASHIASAAVKKA